MAGNTEELLVQIQADISDFRKQMGEVAKLGDKTGTEFEGGFSKAGGSMKKFGAAALGVSAAVGAAAAAGVVAIGTMTNEVQKARGQIMAMTGETEAQASKSMEMVRDVYKNGWGESITQLSNDYAKLKGSLGEVSETALEGAQILGQMYETVDVDSYSRALKNMKTSFPGREEGEIVDLMTKAFQETGDASGDLLDTFNEYAPYAKSMGLSMEDFTNMLINGSKAGARNLDVVGDAMKEFNIRAKDGSKATAEGFKAIGLDAKEMGSAIANGGEEGKRAMEETFAALAKIEDPVKRNAAGVALFGTKFEDLEYDVIKAMGSGQNALGDFEGSLDKAGDALSDNLGTKLSTIKRQIMDAFVAEDSPIYQAMLNIADYILQVLPVVTEGITNFMNAITSLFTNTSGVDTQAGAFSRFFGMFQEVMEVLIPAWIEGFMFFFNTLKEIVEPILSDLVVFVSGILEQIVTFWNEHGETIMKAVSNIFGFIKGVIEFVMPAVKFIIEQVWNSIKLVIKVVLNVILGLFRTFAALFTGDWKGVWEGIKGIFTGYVDALKTFFENSFIGDILGFFKRKIRDFKSLGSDIMSGLFNGIKGGATKVLNKAKEIAEGIKKKIKNALSIFSPSRVMRDFGGFVGEGLIIGMDDEQRNVENKADSLAKSIMNPLSNLKTGVKVGLDKIDMNEALTSAGFTKNALIKASSEKTMKIELALKGGVDKLADEIEGRVVSRFASSIGGSI